MIMPLSIATRLSLLLLAFALLLAASIGYYAWSQSRDALLHAAREELLGANRVLALNLSESLNQSARHVQLLAALPNTRMALASHAPQLAAAARNRQAQAFAQLLHFHPQYSQLRLISLEQFGLERIRVERADGHIRRLRSGQLEEKGHFPYVYLTRQLHAGQVRFSPININDEQGSSDLEQRPNLRIATPVVDSYQQTLGVLVLNIDLERLFNQLRNNLPSHYRLFLANAEGDFLLHPDPQQAFAFERGQRSLLQAQFPALAGLLDEDSAPRVEDLGRQASAEHLVGAFSRVSLDSDQGTRVLILGLAVEHSHVVAGANRLAGQMLQLGLLLSLLAALLALWLGRAFSAPLRAMVKEIQHFSEHRQIGTLPLQREDELGLLARSIYQQQSQILEQIQQLHDSHQAAEHLAHHDSLTGLGNRLLFIDRLQHAISNARRSGKRLALVFVDLDYFKEINDSHGHAMGDAVLRQVANLLRGATRAGDTVARLGGDEFVILYDGLDTHSDLPQIAGKLLARFQNRLLIDGQEIHIQASMGISRFPEDGQDSVSLLQHADRAMYQAKRDGRNRIRFSNEHG